jgi:hypothetical protein
MAKHQLLRDKNKITAWLEKYEISNYVIVPDVNYGFVVNVNDDVNLNCKNLTYIPVKFNEIDGDFSAQSNKLYSLDFAPEKVAGDFDMFNNKLENLTGLPKTIGNDLDIGKNKLSSLIGSPENVENNFCCSHNNLTSLEGGPKQVNGVYYADHNKLENLVFFPELVVGDCVFNKNKAIGHLQEETLFSKFKEVHFQQKLNNNLTIKTNQHNRLKL